MITQLITWLNGISAFTLYVLVWTFFILSIIYYRKTKAHTFVTCMLLGFAVGVGWTGIFLSFMSNILFGDNLPWIIYEIHYVTCTAIPLGSLAIIYTAWDVAGSPNNKKQILIGFGAFSVVYYIVYFATIFTSWNAIVVSPGLAPDTLYDDWLDPAFAFYYFMWLEVGFAAAVTGIGFARFMKSTPGALRKKSLYIVIATLFVGGGILFDLVDFTTFHLYYLWIFRFLVGPGLLLIFYGFKPLK
ncbi:MAG TPA: hypothetical protein VKK79_23525 [Candidatus Lokiarchaeia archaeon]|nr:hypothetical protein [Candidatus Lokiarchaeia archaeon]